MAPASVSLLACALACVACTVDNPNVELPSPNAEQFAVDVYPVLLRDCGFPACHGNPDRFFRVFGPGRTRLSPITEPYEPATRAEIESSYERARSMLVGETPALDLLLLRKTIPAAAGGAGHEGHDDWGRSVYPSTDDPNYQILREWVFSVAQDTGTGSEP